jgi:hypothetical protein
MGLVLSAGLALMYALAPDKGRLHAENGPLEDLQLALWLASVCVAAAAVWRWRRSWRDRLQGIWLGVLALLAAGRELDMQILLTPQHLGRFGIHYRIDWLLDPRASLPLRVALIVLTVAVVGLMLYPPSRLRLPAWRMLRAGDAVLGLIGVAVGCLLAGFVIDDTLRGSRHIPFDVRQALEECVELFGAAAYLAATVVMRRCPLAERYRRAGLPAPPDAGAA